MTDYEQTFEKFWRDLVTNPDGTLNEDQVKRELHDYANMMKEVSEVYDHVTGGRISKPNTLAFEVISEADEHMQFWIDEAARDEYAD